MPPYPLYGETTALPGTSTGTPLHTHSNKFPIEREVILSSADKNTKIPILQEYRRRERNKTMAAISPDAPSKLVAWTTANNSSTGHSMQLPETPLRPHQTYLTPGGMPPYSGGPHTGAVPRTYDPARPRYLPGETQLATPVMVQHEPSARPELAGEQGKLPMSSHGPVEMQPPRHYPIELREDKITIEHATPQHGEGDVKPPGKAFSTRTYHTLKGIISSRFAKNPKEPADPSLSRSNASLCEPNTLNNAEKDVNRSTADVPSKEDDAPGRPAAEGAYARLSGLADSRAGTVGVAYAKALDQGAGGQCVVNVDGNKADGRAAAAAVSADMVHATNQAVYAANAGMRTPAQQPIYSDRNYRSPSASQYAKPNTQPAGHPEQAGGIYMVMRQGGPQYPGATGEKAYQPDGLSAAKPMYQLHPYMGQNGTGSLNGTEHKVSQHTPAINQSAGYTQQQNYPKQQGTPSAYPSHGVGHGSAGEPAAKGGPIGPGLVYQQQPAPIVKTNGGPGGGNLNSYYGPTPREVNGYAAKESKGGGDRTDDAGKGDNKGGGQYAANDDGGKSAPKKAGVNGGFRNKSKLGSGGGGVGSGSGQSSDYDRANVDSGRGSAVSGQQMNRELAETSEESSTTPQGNDAEWVDLVESELRQILDPHPGHPHPHQGAPPGPGGGGGNNSTISDSISSMTPPLPPLSPGGGNSSRYKLSHNASGVYGIKQDYGPIDGRKTSQAQGRGNMSSRFNWSKSSDRNKSQLLGGSVTDITSTTGTGLDSLLDDDVATSIATGDARAIRHQLEGLENMYSQVLQLLGVKRHGMKGQGYQPSDPRFNKRRFHGSVSSVPSSVSSRPIRDKRTRQDERKKVKDIKGINKRFQRLESHVVTLARSVAHLSSEMRTQHLMIQEMENIRSELSALRTHTLAATSRSQSMPRLTSALTSLPSITNPTRVKKLTKFFGDEPPLLRLFLKKLGYEKYAGVFESERVGMVELPYMSEERLQSMGIPLGPRLRILQEAHVSVLSSDQLCVL